jgi:hypothetical protein
MLRNSGLLGVEMPAAEKKTCEPSELGTPVTNAALSGFISTG